MKTPLRITRDETLEILELQELQVRLETLVILVPQAQKEILEILELLVPQALLETLETLVPQALKEILE